MNKTKKNSGNGNGIVKRNVGPVKITTGLPIPAKRSAAKKFVYPFKALNVGDSFGFSTKGKNAGGPTQATYQANKKLAPMHFTLRKIAKDSYRVWRVK